VISDQKCVAYLKKKSSQMYVYILARIRVLFLIKVLLIHKKIVYVIKFAGTNNEGEIFRKFRNVLILHVIFLGHS